MSLIPTKSEESHALTSSSAERSLLPKKSLTVAGVTAIGSDDDVDKIKQVTEQLIKGTMKFEDTTCDPNIKVFFEAHMKSFKLNPVLSKKMYKEESEMVNKASSWMQELASKAEHYHMTDMIKPFFEQFRIFCKILKAFNKNLKNSRNTKDLEVHFRTLKFAFKKLAQSYKDTKDLFSERDEDEPIVWASWMWANKWSFIKWIWKYKYGLYITGTLIYNGTIYVGLPFGNFFDVMIRVVGTICFTFASDKVAMGKLLGFFISIVSQVIWAVYNLIPGMPDFGKLGANAPSAIKSTYNAMKAAVFYIFLWFSLDWISYITKLICQGILVFGASYRAGTESLTGIWSIFAESAQEIQGKTINAAKVILDFVEEMGISLTKGLSFIFVDIIGKNVVAPLFDFIKSIKDIPGSTWSGLKNMMWGDGGEVLDKTGKAIALTVEQKERASALAFITEEGGKEVGVLLRAKGVELQEVVNQALAQIRDDVMKKGPEVFEKVQEKVANNLENTMKSQGTNKLYQATKNLEIGRYTTKQTVMLFVVLALFTWLVSFMR